MNISCIKCGKSFSITAEQLGKRGKCPHCRVTVILPKSTRVTTYQNEQLDPPSRMAENLLAGFATVILHLLILILIALVPWGDFSDGDAGDGEQIMIGHLAREQLTNTELEELEPQDIINPAESQPIDSLQHEFFSTAMENPLAESSLDVTVPSLSGGSQNAFEIQSVESSTFLAGGNEDFGKMVARLQRDGLDIVITFDSTGSMGGEINQVKSRIERIGNVLFKLVPKTRISICTYRDKGDEYVVAGLPLTDNLARVVLFLEDITAAGGGDKPEAVDEGLRWSIEENEFGKRSRKVILLFGDAPPHQDKRILCQQLASKFRKSGGIVSTVTCRSETTLDDFETIAKIGAGESFLTANEREIMTQLIVLVFGSRHRSKVLEAFDLLNNE